MRIDRLGLTGIVLIILGGILLKTGFMDNAVATVFWPILEGSSEGKAVILLVMMGSLLLLSSLITSSSRLNPKIFPGKWFNGRRYLLISLVTMFVTCVVGLLIEVWIRLKFNVSLFTVFTAMNPTPSTTSIMHTHVFKSVIGYMVSLMGETAPHHINTGLAIIQYSSPFAFLALVSLPLAYIAGLLAMTGMRDSYKVVTSFGLAVAIIGMMDGGMFSQPFLIGFGILLFIYSAKNSFSPRTLVKPVLIIFLIILAGFAIEIGGTNTDHYTLTVINQHEPVNMTSYNVTDVQHIDDKTIYTLKPSGGDKEIIKKVFVDFKGKADGSFMTWNFYSYV
ncbi:hypothetical protein [Methanobacterium aggregans]|uniref:hypothetical protein n=1 Tax=Methanobacterium aggregans TaxID=1615586 RepID=UPI001FDA0D02|nr:hypothetical protein [Methanobacterium aggregans]MBP2046522.1 hypothetical protein [Methanobacterium aggregans]